MGTLKICLCYYDRFCVAPQKLWSFLFFQQQIIALQGHGSEYIIVTSSSQFFALQVK